MGGQAPGAGPSVSLDSLGTRKALIMRTRSLTPDLETKATDLTIELLLIFNSLAPDGRAELIRRLKQKASLREAVADWEAAEKKRRCGRLGR